MKRLKTLRVRFALWTAGLLLAALTLFGIFVYLRMAQTLTASVDEALENVAFQVEAEVDVKNGELVAVDDFVEDLANMPLLERGFSFMVFNNAGRPIQEYGPYQTLPLPTNDVTPLQTTGLFTTFTDEVSGHLVRVYTVPVIDHNQIVGIIQVAQNLNNIQQTLNQLLTTLLIGVPLIVIVAGLGGYILAARALAPVDRITHTARHISTNGDLSARLDLSTTDDEIGRLASTFDSMLARLDKAFQRERRFTADASHELRTPLATMQTILSTMLAQPRTPADYEQAMADLFEETDRMRTLTEGLLLLARRDNSHSSTTYETINISNLLADVTDLFTKPAQDKGLTLSVDIPQNLTLDGDWDALLRLFANLLSNAVRYTNQGSITVTAKNSAQRVQVKIEDSGIGIAAGHLPHIFDRFYRVDKSRSSAGTGLGLAIAQEVARNHQGEIMVHSEVGQGTTMIVSLPFSPTQAKDDK